MPAPRRTVAWPHRARRPRCREAADGRTPMPARAPRCRRVPPQPRARTAATAAPVVRVRNRRPSRPHRSDATARVTATIGRTRWRSDPNPAAASNMTAGRTPCRYRSSLWWIAERTSRGSSTHPHTGHHWRRRSVRASSGQEREGQPERQALQVPPGGLRGHPRRRGTFRERVSGKGRQTGERPAPGQPVGEAHREEGAGAESQEDQESGSQARTSGLRGHGQEATGSRKTASLYRHAHASGHEAAGSQQTPRPDLSLAGEEGGAQKTGHGDRARVGGGAVPQRQPVEGVEAGGHKREPFFQIEPPAEAEEQQHVEGGKGHEREASHEDEIGGVVNPQRAGAVAGPAPPAARAPVGFGSPRERSRGSGRSGTRPPVSRHRRRPRIPGTATPGPDGSQSCR